MCYSIIIVLQQNGLYAFLNSFRSINVSKHSSSVCGTKESCNMPINHYTIPKSVKRIACKDLKVSKEDFLGKGVYGKCFSGKIAHLSVCVKAFREQSVYKSTFALEATLLSQCCHANLPWLYGAVFHPKAIVISLHVIEGNSITIHSMCCSSCSNSQPVFTTENWKKILYGVVSAISYLHKKFILHNDIKSNNVVIDKKGTEVNSILIDLGKGCFVKDAKSYHLPSDAARREHVKNYPHIAPDLINGHCKQSTKSDVYSLGRIIHQVNDHHLRLPALESLSKQCMEYYCENRLQITEINTFTYNLFY